MNTINVYYYQEIDILLVSICRKEKLIRLMSDCCLTPTDHLLSYIMARTMLRLDEMMMSVLY